jgi:ubiquinone/menaquinone biosynthesis C-methylase UbiE
MEENRMNRDYYSYNESSFKKLAPFYDLIASPLSSIRYKVVVLSGAGKGTRILNVCTGTGAQALSFGKIGCDVTGIDLSPDMLEKAKRKNTYKNVKFQTADATNMPFVDKQFDISCISFALHDMPREARPRVLDEMNRVSTKVIIIDYHIPDNRLEKWFHVSFTSLYELGYYRDFARQNIKELLRQHDLKITGEAYGLINYVKIFICEGGLQAG